ncbi:MAG: TolC family protein [Phycisphaerae bacterium]|nr:MAG: TolC family protein [Phycisphaerae bacterium]MBE7456644.1 TolC family protein [Planctomycetia bacterium]MCL4718191.1 TolC family protein [Phycisphaerae bacterium]
MSRRGRRISAVCAAAALIVGCRGFEQTAARYKSVPQEFDLRPARRSGVEASLNADGADPETENADSEASVPLLDEGGVLTLERAVEQALRGNPDLQAALARLEAAQARVGQAQAAFWPLVAFTHASSRTFHTPASRNRLALGLQQPTILTTPSDSSTLLDLTTILGLLRLPLFSNLDLKGDRNSFSEHTTAFSLSWLVYDGFAREARERASRHLESASKAAREDAARLIRRSVTTAYHQAQLGEGQLRIAAADEAFGREQLEATRRLLAAQKAAPTDVTNFELRVTAAQANLAAAQGIRDTSLVVLAELLGLAGGRLPEGARLAELSAETAEDLSAPDAAHWLAEAARQRPDLRQLEAFLRSQDENVLAAQALYSPMISLTASWGFTRPSNIEYSVEDQATAAGVEVRWDIFTGGMRRQKVLEAGALRREAEALLRRQHLAVESQVRQAVIEVVRTQREIELNARAVEMSRKIRDAVRAGYDAGKETLTRLNETQRDYITADAELILSRIRLREAWNELRSAAGSPP